MVWDEEEDELPEVAELELDVVLCVALEPEDVDDEPDVPDEELPEEEGEVPAAVAS